jgi:hypothetical protein
MDTRGARELAQRLADEERRRAAAAGGASNEETLGDPDRDDVAVAVDHLQGEIASLRAELTARDDAIARLRIELGEVRAKMRAMDDGHSPPDPQDDGAPTGHVLFVSGPSSYGLLLREGRAPEVGSEIVLADWAEGRYRVCKVGPSPLPSDRRRCAFLERLP